MSWYLDGFKWVLGEYKYKCVCIFKNINVNMQWTNHICQCISIFCYKVVELPHCQLWHELHNMRMLCWCLIAADFQESRAGQCQSAKAHRVRWLNAVPFLTAVMIKWSPLVSTFWHLCQCDACLPRMLFLTWLFELLTEFLTVVVFQMLCSKTLFIFAVCS